MGTIAERPFSSSTLSQKSLLQQHLHTRGIFISIYILKGVFFFLLQSSLFIYHSKAELK